jgi:transcription termination/antitermination protein NusG
METKWYLVKVLPGKERSLAEEFNKHISLGKMKSINRFVCPTEKNVVVIRNKKAIREKVLYSGYLYFETPKQLNEDELKTISLLPNIMGMGGNRIPIELRDSDVKRILVDDVLEQHVDSKRLKYMIGEQVMVVEGPFNTFEGSISEIRGEKVEVEIKIFGRNTAVELTLNQISKI